MSTIPKKPSDLRPGDRVAGAGRIARLDNPAPGLTLAHFDAGFQIAYGTTDIVPVEDNIRDVEVTQYAVLHLIATGVSLPGPWEYASLDGHPVYMNPRTGDLVPAAAAWAQRLPDHDSPAAVTSKDAALGAIVDILDQIAAVPEVDGPPRAHLVGMRNEDAAEVATAALDRIHAVLRAADIPRP